MQFRIKKSSKTMRIQIKGLNFEREIIKKWKRNASSQTIQWKRNEKNDYSILEDIFKRWNNKLPLIKLRHGDQEITVSSRRRRPLFFFIVWTLENFREWEFEWSERTFHRVFDKRHASSAAITRRESEFSTPTPQSQVSIDIERSWEPWIGRNGTCGRRINDICKVWEF